MHIFTWFDNFLSTMFEWKVISNTLKMQGYLKTN